MPAIASGRGITYPQSIKWLGHFLTADCKSARTPNGGRAYPALRKKLSNSNQHTKLLPFQGALLTAAIPRALPWARSFCPFRACSFWRCWTFKTFRACCFWCFWTFRYKCQEGRKTPRRRHNFRRGAAFSCAFYEMNFFRSYPEGGSGALGISIYYVLSYISFSVIPLSYRYAG